jgi:hypothetical protein
MERLLPSDDAALELCYLAQARGNFAAHNNEV